MKIQNRNYQLRYNTTQIQRAPRFTGFRPMNFDALFDEYSPNLRISEQEISKFFSEKTNIIKDFLKLEGYSFDLLLPLKDKKKTELKYLYDIASKKDLADIIRIPANRISSFASFSHEKLKSLEPIILSQNDLHLWNYEPDYILNLTKLDDKRLNIFLDLAKYHVTPHSTQAILEDTEINWAKAVQTAKSLNELYGKDLREIEFFSNTKGQNFFLVDVQLPHNPNTPDWSNYKRITVRLDDDNYPVGRQKLNTHIQSYVDNIYNKTVEKFHIFSKKDLDSTINQVLSKCPDATEEEVLVAINKLTQFSSYKSLQPLAEQLQTKGVTEFLDWGELYRPFNYFVNCKGLFSLYDSEETKLGILITKNDINNPELMNKLKQLKDDPDINNVLFINLEGFADGVNLFTDNYKLPDLAVKTIQQAKLIQKQDKNLTFAECVSSVLNDSIENPLKNLGFDVHTVKFNNPAAKKAILDQMQPIMPSKDAIQSTIETIADKYTMNRSSYNKASESLAKYYQENVNIYSKQSIVDDLKKLDDKIQAYLNENNLSKDNLYIITNTTSYKPKSFDIINRMYRELFKLPENRILHITEITQINKYPENSVFIAIDDIAGTGKSLLEIGEYDHIANKISPKQHILFVPITSTDYAIKNIQENINEMSRDNIDDLIYLKENIAKDLYHNGIFNKILSTLFSFKFSQIVKKGYSKQALCTSFPYMAPDNNSYISSNLVRLFLPSKDCIKSTPDTFGELESNSKYYEIFGQKKKNIKLNPKDYNDEVPGWFAKIKEFIFKY